MTPSSGPSCACCCDMDARSIARRRLSRRPSGVGAKAPFVNLVLGARSRACWRLLRVACALRRHVYGYAWSTADFCPVESKLPRATVCSFRRLDAQIDRCSVFSWVQRAPSVRPQLRRSGVSFPAATSLFFPRAVRGTSSLKSSSSRFLPRGLSSTVREKRRYHQPYVEPAHSRDDEKGVENIGSSTARRVARPGGREAGNTRDAEREREGAQLRIR